MRVDGLRIIPILRRLLLVGLFLAAALVARAERLPVKIYTTADGLPQNSVNRIVRDSRGFIWFCTNEGLSRFDGYTFTNYGVEQGLPDRRVGDLLETREGEYWVATGGGLCRFNPKGLFINRLAPAGDAAGAAAEPMFEVFYPGEDERARFITGLLQDRQGSLWVGTHWGLFRLEWSGGQIALRPVDVGMPMGLREGGWISALCEDRHGTLWAGAFSGLYRRWPDGRTARYTKRDGLPDELIQALCVDREGSLWVGTRQAGFLRLTIDSSPKPPAVARAYTGSVSNWINSIFETSDRTLWIATDNELGELLPSGNERDRALRVHTRENGLSYYHLTSLLEDGAGNLWIGTTRLGAMKLTRRGFHTFGLPEGIAAVLSAFENSSGELYFVGYIPRESGGAKGSDPASEPYYWRIGRFDGQKFTWLRPRLPAWVKYYGWGRNQISFQDRTGEWWIATGQGLFRFPKVNRFEQLQSVPPKAVYRAREGLAAEDIFRLFEDSRGDIWISAFSTERAFAKWERATETLRDMSQAEGLPPIKEQVPTSFEEDAAGRLWVGLSGGALARYAGGRFTLFSSGDGVPAGRIDDLYVDHRGRLWVASTLGGLARVDDTGAQRPTFVTYTTMDGLSSNKTTCLAEDPYGYIYVGSGRGLDRLNPETGHIKHFTAADGLVPGEFEVIYRDRQGAIWIGNWLGLSRFVPRPDPPQAPPPILITGLRIGGAQQPISALGETNIRWPDLSSGQNQLQLDFVGLSFAAGESLRYQYKLEGADRDWSPPSTQRTVNFVSLAPGRYRFLVRAVNADGAESKEPASFSFTILPPVWQRWWFVALAAALLGAIAYYLYRYRVARLLEIERVRTRIAADLHDDIGANLTRIAILSEVAHSRLHDDKSSLETPLSSIADISRESVASMSDIVWAINPKRDHLIDLVQRMRRLAGEVFAGRKIEYEFLAPESDSDLRLGADVRRDVLLIFKEAINNVARHSNCSNVDIELQVERSWLVLRIKDDGRGFDPQGSTEGNGLVSMKRRAATLGGELQLRSTEGRGTEVMLKVPFR